ncbi:MAG: T9SS type A sorting domain-containing protein, partial [candidate division Zixibacteria bacterium]|nr:T9SS type A sorting domain-containing protein [candidate division Zixibacteria bacterium]
KLSDAENPYSQTTGVSRFVTDFDYGGEITDMNYENGFPTYFGVQAECLEGTGFSGKPFPVQFVDFINGGIDIVCADSIDARGDLNLNGIANEIGDATVYTNYFVYGLTAFDYYQAQVAASDVNADGITLSVADLVYLVRTIVGDALPYAKIAPVDANVSFGDAISVNREMGAAYVVIEGNVAPTLLADNMEMKYAHDADQNVTRTLVYSMEANQTFEGEFLNANGNVVSVEMATYEGAPVKIDMVPSSFSLNQNYPNPFNPTTVVSFNVPATVDYTLSVFNITGQEVDVYSGTAEAGLVEIEIDGSGLSSGIYFYKLNAGDFSATKKMVLVK